MHDNTGETDNRVKEGEVSDSDTIYLIMKTICTN